jgi:hypothetical protein
MSPPSRLPSSKKKFPVEWGSDSDDTELDVTKKALRCHCRQRATTAQAKAKTDAAAQKIHKQTARIASKAKRTISRAAKAATRQTHTALANAETKCQTDKADSSSLHKAIQRTPKTTSSLPLRQRLPRYSRRRWPPITSRHHDCDEDVFDDYDEDVQLEADEGKLLYPGKAMPHFTILNNYSRSSSSSSYDFRVI